MFLLENAIEQDVKVYIFTDVSVITFLAKAIHIIRVIFLIYNFITVFYTSRLQHLCIMNPEYAE